jgi:hypothetical protein
MPRSADAGPDFKWCGSQSQIMQPGITHGSVRIAAKCFSEFPGSFFLLSAGDCFAFKRSARLGFQFPYW